MRTGGDHPQIVRFGEFTLDTVRMTLLRGGERLHLTEKPLEVLVFLAQNAGRTVPKAELMEAVWKGTFVTEDNLTQAILKIRRALGDEKEHPEFILTVPRVGYRFIGAAASPSRSSAADGQAVAGEPVRGRRTRPALMLAAGVVVISAAAGFWRAWYFGGAPRPERPTTPAAAPVPEEVPLPTASATKPAYAPDGSNFLFVGYRRERPGIGDIYLASASGTHVRPLTQEMDPR